MTTRLEYSLTLVMREYDYAVAKHGSFPSAHHFAGVMLEEWDEFRDALRRDSLPDMRDEATQMAAICFRFLVDIGDHYDGS